MLPKLFENKKNLIILSQRDLAKVPPNITSIGRTPSLHINPSPIIDPKPNTDHQSINPSTATAPIKPINPTNPSAPIKNQTLHHPPLNPTTTKQTHHNTS